MIFRALPLLLALFTAMPAGAAPTLRPGTKPPGNGSELFSPTKCEWLAVELNSNYRSGNLKSGYTSQFYCRKPNTIFLSFKYLLDSDQEAAELAADNVREAIGQVAKDRNWRWVKVEEEIVKAEVVAPVQAKLSAPKKAKEPTEEEADDAEKEDKASGLSPSLAENIDDAPSELRTRPGSSIKPMNPPPAAPPATSTED